MSDGRPDRSENTVVYANRWAREHGRPMPHPPQTMDDYRYLVDKLRAVITKVDDAITQEGPAPRHHLEVMRHHREEWPALWKALDELLEEFRRPA